MKLKLTTVVCMLALLFTSTTPCSAADDLEMAADVLVVRPACFVATILGSALFVVSLPIAATARSIKRSAHAFVVRPAKATFTRPLGDMDDLIDY